MAGWVGRNGLHSLSEELVWFGGGKRVSHKGKMCHLLFVDNPTVLTGGHVRLDVVIPEGRLALTHPAKGNATQPSDGSTLLNHRP